MRANRFLCAAAAAFLAALPARADQILGGPRVVTGTNAVVLPGGPTLGLWQGGKFTATPYAIQLGGTGSTGDVSSMCAVVPGASACRPLGQRAGDAPGVKDRGAKGDGVTDDRAAILLSDAAGPFTVTAGNYRIGSDTTINSDVTFAPGSYISVDAGATVTLNGQVSAPIGSWMFRGQGSVVVANAPVVSTAWWGAWANRAIDAAPAFRAAVGPNRTVESVPGSYLFCSFVQAGPYGQGVYSGSKNYFPAAVWVAGTDAAFLNNVTFDNRGVTTSTCDQSVPVAHFFFDRNTNAHLIGGTYLGNHNGIANDASSVALVAHNQIGSLFEDFVIGGNFGGGSSGMASNWSYGVTIRKVRMSGVGQVIDFAQAKNLTIDDVKAVGGDATQSGGPGSKGLSLIYDPVGKNDSRLPASLNVTDNENVTITNSEFSNFGSGVFITSGKNYRIIGNHIHDNPGTVTYDSQGNAVPGAQGTGLDIGWYPGFPVTNLLATGNEIENNGAVNAGAGVSIGNGAITNGDVMSGIRIAGNIIRNNRDVGIRATGTGGLTDIDVGDNTFGEGTIQLYKLGGYLPPIQNPPPTSNCGATFAAGSNNDGGQFTEGSGSGGCNITFAKKNTRYPTAANCNVWPLNGAPAPSWSVGPGANGQILFVSNAQGGSPTYGYQCSGN